MVSIIYLWRIASDCPENLIAIHDKRTVDPTLFRMAMPFDGTQPVRFTLQRTRSAIQDEDYMPNSAMLPLVSKDAGSRLQDLAGSSIQNVPAVVVCDDGEIEASVINLLKTTAAVDWNSSKALYIPGTQQVMKFTKLRLSPGALSGLHLARLDEFRALILASERVKSLFATSKLCEFVLAAEVRP